MQQIEELKRRETTDTGVLSDVVKSLMEHVETLRSKKKSLEGNIPDEHVAVGDGRDTVRTDFVPATMEPITEKVMEEQSGPGDVQSVQVEGETLKQTTGGGRSKSGRIYKKKRLGKLRCRDYGVNPVDAVLKSLGNFVVRFGAL
ncbi:hypothetical protein M758_UG020200 [Ceratodon purpureus]|nr:hypothetical protein M758_UG020200 [Ceratodon purpureus]